MIAGIFLGGGRVASAERSPALKSRLENCLDFQTHRLAGKLLFDEHGLTPYWGLVNAFEPEHKDEIGPIEVLDDSFVLKTSRNWNGKIADPNGRLNDGLNEYKYALWCDRDGQERGADFTLRPGYPNARHVDSGDLIGGMPTSCPESIRVHVEATNLSDAEVLELLRALASRIDLNPNYFDEPHEWSSIYALEVYTRVDRDRATSSLAGKGGILEQLAQFSNGRGQGVHKWDHEQIQGHYEGVALDPDSWARLIPIQTLPKRLKCYQPEYVRTEDYGDTLYHHKLECQYWSGYFPKGEGSISWDGYDAAVDELEQTAICALNWAGLPLKPDPDVYIEDGYFAPRESDSETELFSNPLPNLKDQHQDGARLALMDPTATRGEWDILSAVAEHGGGHHAELASKAGRSSSRAYRAIEQFDAVLDVDNGRISFLDEIVRETVTDIVDRLKQHSDNAMHSLKRVAERASPLSDDDSEPSALEQWCNRHGILPRETPDGLRFEFERPVSRWELQKIIRAGLDAAERSSMLTKHFEDAMIDWMNLDGKARHNYRVGNFYLPRSGRQQLARQ